MYLQERSTMQIETIGQMFTSEEARKALIETMGNIDMFFGTAVAQAESLNKIRITAWNTLQQEAQRRMMLQRAGITAEQIETVLGEINMAWPIIFPPIVAVGATVELDAKIVTDAARSTPSRNDVAARMRATARTVGSFIYTEAETQRLADFTFVLATYGYEVAQLDRLVLKALVEGAGRYIQNNWVLQVLDKYRTSKERASDMLIPANLERGIDQFHLELVPEQSRVEFWQVVHEALGRSGFYTLIEQLSFWQRATGKAGALAGFSNVTSTISDARYDPDQMKRLHERVLKALAQFMEDRTRVLMADRIAAEHTTVVQSALEDEDVLYFLCKPPRGVQDVVTYFWQTDQVDLGMERAALRLSEAMTSALEALAKYDPSKGYAEQLSVFGPAANDAVTLLEELGSMITRRYAQVQPSREQGLTGIVNTLFAAVSIRLKIGNTEVRVDTQAGVQQTQQPAQRGGGDSYRVGDISGPGIAIGAGAQVSVTTYNLTSDDIAHQQSLLTSHRRTLSHYLGQKATMGSAYVPPSVLNGIDETRANIARIKTMLRGAGVQVIDHPDDVEIRRY